MADDEGVRRRDVLKGLGVTGAVAGLVATTAPPAVQEAKAQPAAPHVHAVTRDGQAVDTFRFFTPLESAVVVALVDRELAGAYGRGARMYLDGPFGQGTPQQGYQLPLPS